MAVHVITNGRQACLYCSTSMWAFGPVFTGDEAEAKADAFLDWFDGGHALEVATRLVLQMNLLTDADGLDPRDYPPHVLERLYGVWREEALDEDGNLREEVIA